MGHKTKVDFKIHDNYEVIASFSSFGTNYTFKLNKWAKSSGNFAYFTGLVRDRFPSQLGNSTTEQQIINIFKYACAQVFTCVEEIVTKHYRYILDYVAAHIQLDKQSTYEEYIHLMACKCIMYTNFHAPAMPFSLVDFCAKKQDYNPDILDGIECNGDTSSKE